MGVFGEFWSFGEFMQWCGVFCEIWSGLEYFGEAYGVEIGSDICMSYIGVNAFVYEVFRI